MKTGREKSAAVRAAGASWAMKRCLYCDSARIAAASSRTHLERLSNVEV